MGPKNHDEITQQILQDRFIYDPSTGIITHNPYIPKKYFSPYNQYRNYYVHLDKHAGKEAGYINNTGHLVIEWHQYYTRWRYTAARLIYRYMTGDWPALIQHVDGNVLNNRWDNIKSVASVMYNNGGTPRPRRGFNPIQYSNIDNKYHARILYQGKIIWISAHDDVADAQNAVLTYYRTRLAIQ